MEYTKGTRSEGPTSRKAEMLTESELRTMAQELQMELLAEDPDAAEYPSTWTGQYVVLGSVASRFPWNADLLRRSFDTEYTNVALYFDHSVPGAGFGQWYVRLQDGTRVAADTLSQVAAELGLE